jgi:ferredoxin-NADP reductase
VRDFQPHKEQPMSMSTYYESATVAHETHLELVVRGRSYVADGVVMLDLARADQTQLPDWQPGAHIDLILRDDLVRQYSLCGDPGDRTLWRVAVLLEPESRGGSDYVHNHLHIGSAVRVGVPRNHFPLVPASRYLFIAGGIGVTPIIPMLAAATQNGADWKLVYGGRGLNSMAFTDDLRQRYGDHVVVWPQDTHGLPHLDELLSDRGSAGGEALIYCCGPEGLLSAVEQRCRPMPDGVLHVERFAAGDLTPPVLTDAFEVEVDSTGEVYTVEPNQSIMQVLREAGVEVFASCEEGTCGTCETPVLDGVVDHRDFVLTQEERQQSSTMMICVSRAACPRLRLGL